PCDVVPTRSTAHRLRMPVLGTISHLSGLTPLPIRLPPVAYAALRAGRSDWLQISPRQRGATDHVPCGGRRVAAAPLTFHIARTLRKSRSAGAPAQGPAHRRTTRQLAHARR